MYSDTHCHFDRMIERGIDAASLIPALEEGNFRFVMDIGTRPGDFGGRLGALRSACESAAASEGSASLSLDGEGLPAFLHLSCGLWPDAATIASRDESLALLERDIASMLSLARGRANGAAIAALGECGIDRYWNGEAAAARMAQGAATQGGGAQGGESAGTADTAGEEELFAAQIALAEKYGIPFIVHSREAFDVTYSVIRSCGFFRGVIHCFSYGIREAGKFLDLGFYLSFPGNITFSKKADIRESTARLLRYVPRDRLLLETDAPYLAPAPERGTVNTPLKIALTYGAAAEFLGASQEELAEIVYANALKAFKAEGAFSPQGQG